MEVSPFAFASKRNLVKEKSYASKRNLKFGNSLESVRCLTSERSNVNSNLPLCHLVKAEQGLNGELVAPAAWRYWPRSAAPLAALSFLVQNYPWEGCHHDTDLSRALCACLLCLDAYLTNSKRDLEAEQLY